MRDKRGSGMYEFPALLEIAGREAYLHLSSSPKLVMRRQSWACLRVSCPCLLAPVAFLLVVGVLDDIHVGEHDQTL